MRNKCCVQRKNICLSFFILFLSVLCACGKTGNDNGNEDWEPLNSSKVEKREASFKSGHKLSQLEKKGEPFKYYCNLESNQINGMAAMVCYDPVYDLDYFVNHGRDEYIYVKRGNKAELAVEIPAKDLFCRNGELYFVVVETPKDTLIDLEKNDVMKYNPVSGEVQKIVSVDKPDMKLSAMRVYPDEIYFYLANYDRNESWREDYQDTYEIYRFSDGSVHDAPELYGIDRYKENSFYKKDIILPETDELVKQYRASGITDAFLFTAAELLDKEGKPIYDCEKLIHFPSEYLILEDNLYYVSQNALTSSVMKFDLRTGNQTELFQVNGFETNLHFFQNRIYLTHFRYSLADGTLDKTKINIGTETSITMGRFFSTNTTLYQVVNGKLFEVAITKEEQENSEQGETYLFSFINPIGE